VRQPHAIASKVAFFIATLFLLTIVYFDGTDLELAVWKGLGSAAILVSIVLSWTQYFRHSLTVTIADTPVVPLLSTAYRSLLRALTAVWVVTKLTWTAVVIIFILGGIVGILKFGWAQL
jgi:hypothetical protein